MTVGIYVVIFCVLTPCDGEGKVGMVLEEHQNGGTTFLRNVDNHLPDYTVS
jgi:hypothetical protein